MLILRFKIADYYVLLCFYKKAIEKDCGSNGVIQTKCVDEAMKEKIAKAYQEWSNL